MKCPQCSVRNSVAATQCKDCGTKFARKGPPKALIFGAAGIVAVAGIAVAALSIVPAAFDPEVGLQKIAKRVATGPKSVADAEHIKAELESTAKDFLEKNTKLSSAELTATLQKIFPNSAFEVRVFELPHDLRLVEIDTMLQATDYLMSGKHVAVLRGFEVFETAKVITDPAGDKIVLLGHRNAQAGRQPQVRVFALLPNGVADRTAESVPPISGDGSAAFATNGKDINLDMSLMSKAGEEKLFTIDSLSKGVLAEENVKSRLTFKDGKYELTEDQGRSPAACLRALAFVLADSSAKDRFRQYFTDSTIGSVTNFGKLKVNPPLFSLNKIRGTAAGDGGSAPAADDNSGGRRSRRRRRHSDSGVASAGGGPLTYVLNNAQDAFEVTMSRNDGVYVVSAVKRIDPTPLASDAVAEVTPAGSSVKVPDASNSKIVTKVDEYGSKKIVTIDAAPAATVKGATDVAAGDKVKVASVVPPVGVGQENDTHKQITAKVSEKKADAEEGVVLKSLNTPSIKVRNGASVGSSSVGELKRGEAVQIIGKKDGWYKVQVNGKEGFVFGGYVDCKTNDAYTTAVARRGRNIRDGNDQKVAEVHEGDRVVVIGRAKNGKYQVTLPTGQTGLVDRDTLSMSAGSGSTVEPAVEQPVTAPVVKTERAEKVETRHSAPAVEVKTKSSEGRSGSRSSDSRTGHSSESQSGRSSESRNGHSSESRHGHSSESRHEHSSGSRSGRSSEGHGLSSDSNSGSGESHDNGSSRHSRHRSKGSQSSKPMGVPADQPQMVP